MFDQKLKQAYQSITPPSELKQKILEMSACARTNAHAKVLHLKPLMTLAACFVLLLGSIAVISQLAQGPQTDILLQGNVTPQSTPISFTPQIVDYIMPAAPRMASNEPIAYSEWKSGAAIDLQFSSDEEMQLSVDEGILYMLSTVDGEENVTAVGESLSLPAGEHEITVRWVIPMTEQDGSYCMTVGDEVICVNHHAATNEYTVSRTDADR